MTYDWIATLCFLAMTIGVTIIGKKLIFLIPDLERMRQLNREQDKIKKAKDKYPPIIRANSKVGLSCNLIFFIAVAPFFVTLNPQPWWFVPLHLFTILMVYDFFYYLMHRFLFHGEGYFRRVHALHHQARNPTYIDAHYVHPVETFMGITLFMVTIVGLGFFLGPYHAVTMALAFIVFTQLNIVNHTHVDLPYTPYKTLSWITAKHAVHHENMHRGNYATITLLFDKMFGTLD